jgi:hypothetical protein
VVKAAKDPMWSKFKTLITYKGFKKPTEKPRKGKMTKCERREMLATIKT